MSTHPRLAARFQRASDQSLLVYLGEEISMEAHERTRGLLRLLEATPIPGVRNLHPAYCSLLVKFDPLDLRHEDIERMLREYIKRLGNLTASEPRKIDIPVCYGGEFGPDLPEVSSTLGLTPERVIELHASQTYAVFFLGFVPGFAYLGELPKELEMPRMAVPRRKVPAGSVGIAGRQTGVYPVATPGGWRLLGRTPVAMLRPDRKELSLLRMGDRVRFTPISRERFADLESA